VSAADIVERGLKNAARSALTAAVESGVVVRGTVCEACGCDSPALEAHHFSYRPESWLDVMWLHPECHRAVHHGRIPEPRTGRWYPACANRDGEGVGPLLRSIRTARGMSLVEVASAVGVSREAVWKWEAPNGHRESRTPGNAEIARILTVTGASPEDRAAVWVAAGVPAADLATAPLTEAAA
jgi:DNA-binding XRE family transcriptional regulator